MLGESTLPDLEFTKKRSRAVKIVKRDSRSIKTVRTRFFPCLSSAMHIYRRLDHSSLLCFTLLVLSNETLEYIPCRPFLYCHD
ncbi:hypothetical protein LINGRAPRIM_LOCUS887 [Linum grandiflorum]